MPQKTKAPKQVHIRIRLDQSLLDRLEKARTANGRTLTGEITERLVRSFQQQDVYAFIEHTAKATAGLTSATIIHTIESRDLGRGYKISDLKIPFEPPPKEPESK
jgi:hypothetical protein